MDKKEKALLEGCVPNITFNEETVFPEEMSDTFPAKEYLEAGKKPGLGVESLHEQGITGKGVSIAVIDQVLYTGHPEYASRLALYEEMHVIPNQTGSMHAAALASLSVGDSCGVAPDAKLYFWGLDNVLSWKEEGENNLAWEEYARVIDRIIKVNNDPGGVLPCGYGDIHGNYPYAAGRQSKLHLSCYQSSGPYFLFTGRTMTEFLLEKITHVGDTDLEFIRGYGNGKIGRGIAFLSIVHLYEAPHRPSGKP